MNVYVIYKFSDEKKVTNYIKKFKEDDKDNILQFFKFEPSKKYFFWHKKAKQKMKYCNVVCYFFSNENKKGIAAKNIKWELNLANRYNKRVLIFNLDEICLQTKDLKSDFSKSIFGIDYSDELLNINKYKVFSVEDAFQILIKEAQWTIDKDVINKRFEKGGIEEVAYYNLLLEEYKIMVETSEKLMDRRQNTSNLYTTLSTALSAVIGASFAFNNWTVVAFVGFISGIIFIFMSINWRSCLKAYEMNNAGKFLVINAIEKVLPANLFDSEYRYNSKNGIKSYSGREKVLPIIFILFGILVIFFSIIIFFLKGFNFLW